MSPIVTPCTHCNGSGRTYEEPNDPDSASCMCEACAGLGETSTCGCGAELDNDGVFRGGCADCEREAQEAEERYERSMW